MSLLDHDNLEEYADPAAYDRENGLDIEERFFQGWAHRFAAETGVRRVLDVGCGTGRLSLPLASGGLAVTGIDLTPAMLAEAKAKAAAMEPRPEVTFRAGDIRHLALAERFGFALATGHVVQFMLTAVDRLALFEGVRRHLVPGGGFAFEVRNPAAETLASRSRRFLWRETGRVRIEATTHWDPETRILHYCLFRPAGDGEAMSRVSLHFPWPEEVEDDLDRAGFASVDRYGDWTDRPSAASDEELCFVARCAG